MPQEKTFDKNPNDVKIFGHFSMSLLAPILKSLYLDMNIKTYYFIKEGKLGIGLSYRF